MTQPDQTKPSPPPVTALAAEDKLRRVELLISLLLRGGVTASLALIVLGVGLSFVHHPKYATSPVELVRLTSPGAVFPRTLPQVAAGMQQLQGRAFIMAGLLVLIVTPVLRVAVSIVGFAYQGDRTFVIITSIVLALLLLSFLVGKVER
jgi:uncharacterized membrane protein